jgi:hypothetical protein
MNAVRAPERDDTRNTRMITATRPPKIDLSQNFIQVCQSQKSEDLFHAGRKAKQKHYPYPRGSNWVRFQQISWK